MARIALITDSTSDLSPQDRQMLDVAMIPLNIHFGTEVFADQVDITPATFLQKLASSNDLPRTSQPSPALYTEACDALLADHDQVLIVTLSSKLSGTHQSAVLGANASAAPERVRIVDSLSASIGLGLQVRRARTLIDQGLDIDTIAQTLVDEREFYHLIFFADTLEYLQRGGRIGKASQLVGSILKIKPLLLCQDGEVAPYERTRNRSRAIEGIIDYAHRFQHIETLAMLHDGTSGVDVQTMRDGLADLIDPDAIVTSLYGPIVATHVGAGAMGLCVFDRHGPG